MKKLLFIVSFIFLICACTKKQPEFTQPQISQGIIKQESSCKIGEYDCWEIIQDFKKDTLFAADSGITYNPSLTKKRLPLIKYENNGGKSISCQLSYQISIFIDYDNCHDTYGYATISDSINKIKFIYDPEGNIVGVEENVK